MANYVCMYDEPKCNLFGSDGLNFIRWPPKQRYSHHIPVNKQHFVKQTRHGVEHNIASSRSQKTFAIHCICTYNVLLQFNTIRLELELEIQYVILILFATVLLKN